MRDVGGGASVPRRSFLVGAGAIIVNFSLSGHGSAQQAGGGEGGAGPAIVAPELTADLRMHPVLDAWIRIDKNGHIVVFTGKAELGQGIRTALIQVAAEELDVPPGSIELITADTSRTPDEGLTAGSHSMQDSGRAIQNAAANVLDLLKRRAAQAWGVDPAELTTNGGGEVLAPRGRRIAYGVLASAVSLHEPARPGVPLRDPGAYRTIGKSIPRVDIWAKLSGGEAFIQDMRLPGMLHARVVRGPSYLTRLDTINVGAARQMADVVSIVQVGEFTAVVATREWSAVRALRHLQGGAFSRPAAPIPTRSAREILKSLPSQQIAILDSPGTGRAPVRTLRASYSRPWLHHGSIGPSCAVALYESGTMTIWSHSQGIFDVRRVASELCGLPIETVRAIHVPGSGCYGQNGADDAAADAALIALHTPGRPIRLQWMREQEQGWEPLGPGMVTEVEASIDAEGRVASWRYTVWSNPHNNRPVGAGGVIAGQEVHPPFKVPDGKPIPMPEGDGSRNANPLYPFAGMHVVYQFAKDMPIRVSALRSLGAHLNVFSIESMLDELAAAAQTDPLDIRLRHMEDPRARDVMQKAASRFGWNARRRGDGVRGCGMAFARYKNIGAYCAIVMEVDVDADSGRVRVLRAVAAVDCGQPVSPDGVKNQIEGGILQSLSWTSLEEARFDSLHRQSFDWGSYPIHRFADVAEQVEVHIVERPGSPFLGTAEAAQGPAAAAFANAIADATGLRLRDMPLSADRVRKGLLPALGA